MKKTILFVAKAFRLAFAAALLSAVFCLVSWRWENFLWGGIGVFCALAVVFPIFSAVRNFRVMMWLQKVAEKNPVKFYLFVEDRDGWEIMASPDEQSKPQEWIRIIPEPHVSTRYYYYLRFTGFGDEREEVIKLIMDFLRSCLNSERKSIEE